MGIKFDSFPINGIDVSEYNGVIDWSKVAGDFVSIRVGYGANIDVKFIQNIEGAQKTDLDIFVYWYSDYYSNWFNKNHSAYGLTDEAWGRKQADLCYSQMKKYGINLMFLDIENMTNSTFPKLTEPLAKEHAQKINRAFLERMDELKVTAGIYTSLGWLTWFYQWFRNRLLWVAFYPYRTADVSSDYVIQRAASNGWTGSVLIWQYASDGDVDDNGTPDGISMGMQYSFLDLNGWIGTNAQYESMFSTTIDTPDDEAEVIPQPEYKTYTVEVSSWLWLNIREQPTTNSPVRGRLLRGAKVNVSNISNGWGKLHGQELYISTQYLK